MAASLCPHMCPLGLVPFSSLLQSLHRPLLSTRALGLSQDLFSAVSRGLSPQLSVCCPRGMVLLQLPARLGEGWVWVPSRAWPLFP